MSQRITSEEPQGELSWEEAVARYLEEHADFFERHPALLGSLRLSHEVSGRAVSLIERQVQVLREREEGLQRQLRDLVSIARENDVLGSRLHRFALALLEASSTDEVLDSANELLREEFRLDAVAVRLGSEAPQTGARPEYVDAEDRHLADLLRQLNGGKPVCGGKYETRLLSFLFGERHGEVHSIALMRLGERPVRGVLALGSSDPHRFHAGMGTVYLARLGELLAQALARAGRG